MKDGLSDNALKAITVSATALLWMGFWYLLMGPRHTTVTYVIEVDQPKDKKAA